MSGNSQSFFGQVNGGGWAGNKPVDGQRINTNIHLAMQVQTAQHRFRPLSVSPTMSFLAVYANLFNNNKTNYVNKMMRLFSLVKGL
jgi:hypothetical protein